jgi:hypothetical protein
VHVSFGYATNPLLKQLVFFNGARSGFNTPTLAQDNAPEDSYLLPIRTLAPALVIGGIDQTNDMAGPTAWATFDTAATAIIANARLNGDMIGFTDPPSATSFFTQAVQDKVTDQGRASFWKATGGVVPYYDFYSFGTEATLFSRGYYGNDNQHLDTRGQKRGKGNQIAALLKRLLAAA